jgi:hypothetical protein
MKYYSLDPITKEYTGFNEVAQIDPRESELAGEDVYLCPAHACLVQPPETGANEIAVWDDWKGGMCLKIFVGRNIGTGKPMNLK